MTLMNFLETRFDQLITEQHIRAAVLMTENSQAGQVTVTVLTGINYTGTEHI